MGIFSFLPSIAHPPLSKKSDTLGTLRRR